MSSPIIKIPQRELKLSFARSGGKGGQNVNKVSTKVILRWDVNKSRALDSAQRDLILSKLGNRINNGGIFQLSEDKFSSQDKNRTLVLKRFYLLIAKAFHVRKPRIKKKKPRSVEERRLESKRIAADKKRSRGKIDW